MFLGATYFARWTSSHELLTYSCLLVFWGLLVWRCTVRRRWRQRLRERELRELETSADPVDSMSGALGSNTPWSCYRHLIVPEGAGHCQLLIPMSGQPLSALLTAPKGLAEGLVVTCPGIYRCTEGPACLYNDLASVLPVAGIAVLQLNVESPYFSLSDAVDELLAVMSYASEGNMNLKLPVKIILVGWSMGGAAVVEAACQFNSQRLTASPTAAPKTTISRRMGSCMGMFARSHSSSSPKASARTSNSQHFADLDLVKGVATLACMTSGARNVKHLNVPLFFAHGLDDPILPARHCMATLKRLAPHPEKVTELNLEYATHSLEHPDLTPALTHWVVSTLGVPAAHRGLLLPALDSRAQEDVQLAVGAEVSFEPDHLSSGVWIELPHPPGWRFVTRGNGTIVKLDFCDGPHEPKFTVQFRSGECVRVPPISLRRK